MTLILRFYYPSPWQPHPLCHAESSTDEALNQHRYEVKAGWSDGCVLDGGTDCVCTSRWSAAWCWAKASAALSSFVRCCRWSCVKPLLERFLILKMHLLIILQGTREASPEIEAAGDLRPAYSFLEKISVFLFYLVFFFHFNNAVDSTCSSSSSKHAVKAQCGTPFAMTHTAF